MRKAASKSRQSGNIFFMLFGAVGLVGVVGAATTTIMKGPVRSMSEVTKNTVAENAMVAAGRLALVSAATQAQHGDCDNDQYIEPLPFSDTGTGPRPAGGGYLPPSIGAAQKDPWGSTYGYCSWDHGTKINDAGCGGAAQKRLRGSATEEKIALAVISAGPNRVFETSCGHDPAYLVRVSGSDDVILEYTYAESKTLGGVLWNLKENTVDTAEITKNLEVKNTGGNVVMAFDSTSAPSQPSLKVDFIAKLTGAKKGVEYLSNIMLGANWLSGDGDNEGIRIDGAGNVTASGEVISNNANGFRLVYGNYGSVLRNDGNATYWLLTNSGNQYGMYNGLRPIGIENATGNVTLVNRFFVRHSDGNVGIGTTAPRSALDVRGQITGGFGAAATLGAQDWNDASNAVPGSGYTLLRGTTSANAPSASGNYFHPFSFEYANKTGAGNLTQFAIPYSPAASLNEGLFYRGRSSGTWTGWYRIPSENPSGNMVVKGALTAASFTGVGTNLTALNAWQLTSGTVPVARLSGSYTGITGTGALNAGSITSGFGNINIGTAALTAGTGTFSGAVSIATAPTANAHAANKAYVDSNIATAGNGRFLPLTGGTLTGSLTMGGTSTINMNSSKIINLANPTAAADAANKSYVDTNVATAGNGRFLPLAGGTMEANAVVQFGNQATDKVRWYSNIYGTGIESSTLTHWSAGNHRWRIGGTSVSSGTERMLLNSTGLTVTGTTTATAFAGSGTSLTALNASQLTTGTVPTARLGSGTANATTYLRGDSTWQPLSSIGSGTYLPLAGGTLTGNLFFTGGTRYIGTSDNNTFVIRTNNTDRLTIAASGTATFSGAVSALSFAGSGASLTALNASQLTTGTVPNGRLNGNYSGLGTVTATAFSGSGASLTSLNASNLASGTVPVARLAGSYTGITGTGALNAGSISSGFGNINIGSSSITAGPSTFSGNVSVVNFLGTAVRAETNDGIGGHFISNGNNSIGVYGTTAYGSNSYGVYGRAIHHSSYGVYSEGNAHVQGDLTVDGLVSAVAEPTAANHLTTKAYVDSVAGGSGGGGAACGAGNLSVQVIQRSLYCGNLQVTGATVTAACPAAAHGQIATCTAGYYGTAWYQCWNGVKTQAGAGFVNAGETGGSCW